ncbi:MAG TPA: Ig-like domain-containing protein [Terriglobales bacterium]|nr:Ig-like domain-containing protein [Terriglobales bacterium]
MKQRYLSGSLFILILFSVVLMPGCGGGGSDTSATDNKVTTITVNPTNLSMEFGQVMALSALATNANATLVATTFTFTSGNTAVVQVSTGGNVCAGTWDANFVVCTPSTTAGSTTITVAGGGITKTVPVSTHKRIANVTITSTGVPCTSQTKTQQFTFKAFGADGTDITSTVGIPTWNTTNGDVATLDANGLATAKRPGVINITAVVNNVVSVPVQMITCPPASIALKEKDSNPAVTSFVIDTAVNKTLAADVIDTLGNPITDIVLQYSSSQTSVAAVTSGGILTSSSAGKAGIIASCTPPSCNPGGTPVYSNLVTVTVNGTSASTVYATGKNATMIIPIDTATNVAGTGINIPTVTVNSVATNPVVTSMMFTSDGNIAYVGTDQSLLSLSAVTGTIATAASIAGTVLAISPDNSKVLVSNPATSNVYIFNPLATPSPTVQTLTIPNATAAAFTPDSLKVYIVSGTTVYVFSTGVTATLFTTSSAVNDAVVLQQGNYVYLAGDVGSTISTRATCNNASLTALATAQKPLLMETNFNGTHVFGTDGANMYDVGVTAGTSPCPPPAPAQALTTTSYGVASTPKQLIVPANIAKTYLTNSTPQLLVYEPGVGASTVTLAAGATASTTGGATLDGKSVYVGALGTNDVQKVDTATGLVVQIPVGLKDKNSATTTPDFVVVRPK